MDLLQLEYFLAVARTEHFGKAAEELNVSQSTISMAITRLEDELGVHLFSKYGRRKYLTSTGIVFKNYVDQAMQKLSMAKVEAQLKEQVTQNVINIACDSIEAIITAETALLEKSHDFTIHQFLTSTKNVETSLMTQKVDLAFHLGSFNNDDIVSTSLLNERIGLLVSKRHPLAECKSVRLKDLVNEKFITLYPETSYRDMTDSFFRHVGFTPNIVLEALDMHMIYSAVSKNVGVAFLSDGGWHQNMVLAGPNILSETMRIIPIEDTICNRTFSIACLKNHQLSPSAWFVYIFFTEHFQKIEEGQIKFRKEMGWI